MRLIDADNFIENVSSGLYVYLQANAQDVIDAINDEPTIKLRPQGEWIVDEEHSIFSNYATSWWKIKDTIDAEMEKRKTHQGRLCTYLGGSCLKKFEN